MPAPQVRTVYVQRPVPAAARVPCARPSKLPERRLSEADITAALARDGVALIECEARRRAAVDGARP